MDHVCLGENSCSWSRYVDWGIGLSTDLEYLYLELTEFHLTAHVLHNSDKFDHSLPWGSGSLPGDKYNSLGSNITPWGQL